MEKLILSYTWDDLQEQFDQIWGVSRLRNLKSLDKLAKPWQPISYMKESLHLLEAATDY
jgi:hypothetical protein